MWASPSQVNISSSSTDDDCNAKMLTCKHVLLVDLWPWKKMRSRKQPHFVDEPTFSSSPKITIWRVAATKTILLFRTLESNPADHSTFQLSFNFSGLFWLVDFDGSQMIESYLLFHNRMWCQERFTATKMMVGQYLLATEVGKMENGCLLWRWYKSMMLMVWRQENTFVNIEWPILIHLGVWCLAQVFFFWKLCNVTFCWKLWCWWQQETPFCFV